ncbi:MAG TPA: hypothetical protein ENK98_05205, partial [Epsilonproteobacteria bacterium]|nr:hypothetical protein [Campylobacterota bacterium]
MIRYVFLLFLLVPMVHADLMERMGSEVQEFRIYPRIQKAENLIAKGDLKEAKILLEKVLDIKPDEKRSSQMLANICLELEDKQCLEKYIHTLKPKAFVAYALAYINYKDKNYAKAYALSKSVDANKLPSKSQRQSLKIIQLQSAIILGKTDKLSSWLSGVMNTYPACSNIRLDMISLLLEYHHIKEALPYIKSIKKSCKSNIKVQKKLLVWAEILRDENYKKESLSILSSLPDSLQKDEAQLSVLITKKAYTKALNVMEKIYAIEPNEKNTKRLAYLYSKTHRYKPLKKLYIHAYKKKPDPDILKHILYSEKSGEVDTNYLEAYYPYDGLSVKEKFNFSAALIKKYKKEGKQTKIPSILNDLSSYAPLSTKEKEVLSHLYLQNGNIHQSIKLMEELYSSHPEQKYRKKLLYLYDKAGNFTKQQESLLLSSASKKCDADTIHAILNLKSNSNNSYKTLENYLPFSCVNEKTKRNVAKKLGDYYKKYGQKKKFLDVYKLLLKDNSLSVNALFDIAYLFKRESSMRDYVSTLSKILKKNPRNYYANLAL